MNLHLEFGRTISLALVISVPVAVAVISLGFRAWRASRARKRSV